MQLKIKKKRKSERKIQREFPCSQPEVKGSQSCLTLCDPMDYSLPGSSIHGIFQARVLEWGAIVYPS